MPKWIKITLLALGVGIVGLIVQFLPIIIMVISAVNAKIEVYDDISSYGNYLAGADRDGKNKWSKWDMDESIWPSRITDSMKVLDYKMVDYAELEDGSWKIIEAGDGSVSGLSDKQDHKAFFRSLYQCLN